MKYKNYLFLILISSIFFISFSSSKLIQEEETNYVEQNLEEKWNLIAE